MRILLTGATGFVGSHLARALHLDGHQVFALVRAGSNLKEIGSFLPPERLFSVDASGFCFEEALAGLQPRGVIHLASRFLAQHQPADIPDLFQANLLFAARVLEAAVRSGCRWFINTGTSWQHFRDASYNPVNLYAATKQAFEAVIRYYVETSSIKACTLKLFDTYGPRDTRTKLFSLLRRTARSGEPLAMSKGDQLLDLVYIDDVTAAYLKAAAWLETILEDKTRCTVFSVSAGRRYALREVVAIYSSIRGVSLDIRWGERPYRKREVMAPWSRGRPVPGWKAEISLEEGIRRIES